MTTSGVAPSPLRLSLPLFVLVAVTGGAGLFWPPTNAHETPTWAAEGIGGDAVNLFVVAPVLLVSALLAQQGFLSARLVWMGTLLFLLYFYVIYALDVHFNALFLVYCGGLSLSFYALVGSLPFLSTSEIAARYGPRAPVKTMAAVLLLITISAALTELGEIIPCLFSGSIPKSITDTGLPTNPVHVLDLALLLPAFVIAAIALLRRKPVAFVLAPTLMVVVILMSLAVAAMIAFGTFKGIGPGYVLAGIFVSMAAACAVLLARYLWV